MSSLYIRYLNIIGSCGEFNPFTFIKSLPPPKHRESLVCCVPMKSIDRMTLVLDLDETLVHCSVVPISNAELSFPVIFNGVTYTVYVRRRPYFQEFLRFVSQKFEVIVFTASQKVYADKLLDLLDPTHELIHHRVFRDACIPINGNYLKDLAVLGRDMARTVIIDNSPYAFGFHLENGIPIESWFDDDNDEELLHMLPFLEDLEKLQDVRPMIRRVFRLTEIVSRS
jgi:CTD small phosphatase-like protein 2